MKKKIIVLLFMFSGVILVAQSINVKGTVKDAKTGDPLPGVSILLKGTTIGTQTDFDGLFNLSNVKKGSVLEFNYLGYAKKDVIVNQQSINVLLQESAESLDEIIVVGYGTQRKKEITGAIAVVSSESIERLKPVQVEQALQGQVAGVNITSNSGAPGKASNIRIRGISTNGDSRPLILLDGNVIEDLTVVNPSDIESINVLKDATAGIYGVRAANGVILITTKNGRKNSDFTVDFNTYAGIQQTTRKIPVLNATEYALLTNEAFGANGQALPFTNISSIGQGTDWQDAVFNNALVSSSDFTIKKGTEKSTYSFGASYLDQYGIVGSGKSNFKRFTSRFNFNTDILENLKLTTSFLYTNTNTTSLSENTLGSVLFNGLNMAPIIPLRDENGDYTLAPNQGIEIINPLAQTENTFNISTVNKISAVVGLNYTFFKHFSIEPRIQYNRAVVNADNFFPEISYGLSKVFNVPRSNVIVDERIFEDYTFDALLRYEQSFKDVHNLKLLLGTSVFKTTGDVRSRLQGFEIQGNSYANAIIANTTDVQDLKVLENIPDPSFDSRLLSYFLRLQYDYDGKYLFSGVLRRDGSSKFGPENKFGYFPTGSIGWVMSKENFFENIETINFLKLRASYGIIGNDRIGDFRFATFIGGEAEAVFDDTITQGAAFGAIGNPIIKWEQQKTLDIGLDLTLFNNAVDITVDYFNKRTDDLLVQPQVSGIIGPNAPGSSPPFVNGGNVENKGLEFSIGYNKNVSDDFSYNVNYNFTTLQNEVLSVNTDDGFLQGGSFGIGQDPPARMQAGLPIGYFYGFQTNGIFQTQAEVDAHATQNNANPGDIRFVDQLTIDTNNDGIPDMADGIINGDDKTYIGDPIPDITMGLNLSVNYKNFDFSAYAFASIGNEIVRNYERNLPQTNRPTYYLDRWTGPGTSNSFPRVTTGATDNVLFSDFYVEDGSFVRLQNIQLGYSLSKNALEQLGASKLRFYVTASNLVTLTKYRGYDPTATSGDPIGGGIDQGFYPTPRTFLLGLNVNF